LIGESSRAAPGPPRFPGRSPLVLVVVILLTAILSSGATYAAVQFVGAGATRDRLISTLESTEAFDRFLEVMSIVERDYVEDVEIEALVEGATSGMVRALDDPYSAYMDPSRYKELMVHTSGTYVGVGVAVIEKDEFVTVVTPFRGTPASEAGLKPGDRIVAVDGRDVVGMPINNVVKLIRGPEGTVVVLTILREGREGTFDVEVERAVIRVPTVEVHTFPGGVGYLQIVQFNARTADEARQALSSLEKEGIEALVVDVRRNPGGLLDQAVEVAEMLIPEGPVVHLVDRDGNRTTYSSKTPGLGLPLAVLVDGGSASAAEILAGAVQDNEAGVIVGATTFGKASVQKLHELDNGAGLRLTTARYLTPDGRMIDREGIEPDEVVEVDDIETFEPFPIGDAESDVQLSRALEILRERCGRGS